jgi:hypothetical protein
MVDGLSRLPSEGVPISTAVRRPTSFETAHRSTRLSEFAEAV